MDLLLRNAALFGNPVSPISAIPVPNNALLYTSGALAILFGLTAIGVLVLGAMYFYVNSKRAKQTGDDEVGEPVSAKSDLRDYRDSIRIRYGFIFFACFFVIILTRFFFPPDFFGSFANWSIVSIILYPLLFWGALIGGFYSILRTISSFWARPKLNKSNELEETKIIGVEKPSDKGNLAKRRAVLKRALGFLFTGGVFAAIASVLAFFLSIALGSRSPAWWELEHLETEEADYD